MALLESVPMNEEAEVVSIIDYVERRKTIIMDCTNPDTGRPFDKTSDYCEATASYLRTMNDAEATKHKENLRELAKKAHPASGTISLKETLRRIGV